MSLNDPRDKYLRHCLAVLLRRCSTPEHTLQWVTLKVGVAPMGGVTREDQWEPDRPGAFTILEAFWSGQHRVDGQSMRHAIQSDWRIIGLDKDRDILDMLAGMIDFWDMATTGPVMQ